MIDEKLIWRILDSENWAYLDEYIEDLEYLQTVIRHNPEEFIDAIEVLIDDAKDEQEKNEFRYCFKH